MKTYEEKYKWLISKLKVANIDHWEMDALVKLESPIYFQYYKVEDKQNIDYTIEWAMNNE